MGMVMSMRGITPELERWQLDVDGVRSRMYLAPTPRERTVARSVAPVPGHDRLGHRRGTGGRDVHTIGRWATAFSEGGPAALIFEQSDGSPRAGSGAAGGTEGDIAGVARQVWHRLGQLELESHL